jgi:O-antigen/teichoic acid export membrane protein
MSLGKRFAFGLVWNFIGKIIIGLCGAVISVLIARNLGKTELGIYASIITIPVTLRLFTSFGFETILNVKLPFLSATENSREKMRFLVRKLFYYRFILFFASTVILYFGMPFFQTFFSNFDFSQYFFQINFYFGVLIFFSLITIIFRALMEIKFVSMMEGIQQVLNLVFLIILFFYGFGIKGILIAFNMSTFLMICVFFFFARDFFWGKKIKIDIQESYQIGVASAIGSFVAFGLGTQADIIMLNFFNVSGSEIGCYFLCISLVSMLVFHLQGIGPIAQSAFSEVYARNGTNGLGNSWSTVTEVVALFSVPVYVFAIFNARSIIELLYGQQYLDAAIYVSIFSIFSCFCSMIGSGFCMPVFYLIQEKALGVKIQLLGGVLNLILNFLLIPHYGVLGVVIATGFSQFLSGFIEMLFLRQYTRMVFPFIFEFKIVISCFVAVLPIFYFHDKGFLMFLLNAILYCVIFFIMVFILKPFKYETKLLLKGIDPRLYRLIEYF